MTDRPELDVRRVLNLVSELKLIQQYREKLVSDERRVIGELEKEIGRYQNNAG